MTLSWIIGVIGSVVLFFIGLRRLVNQANHGVTEPPAAPSSIPVVGHVLGMMRHKVFYHQMLRDRFNAPIFSVPMLGTKIYIVTSPKLVSLVQRNTKALAFEPVVANFSKKIAGCSEEAQQKIDYNIDGSKGERGYVRTFAKNIYPPLAPGPALDDMNRIMIQNVTKSATRLAGSAKRINLYKWLRHEITLATTYAVYGPANPIADPEVEKAFWDYEKHLLGLLIDFLPSITARKATKARAKLQDAFYKYFEKKEHLSGSALVQARYNHSREYEVGNKDIAAFEAGGCFATLANTFPVAYWTLAYIYSHPDVLQDCRREVESITKVTQTGDGKTLHTIDMTAIKSSCPIITATLQEVLRHTAVGSTVRYVVEDTLLDGYTLKKGNVLMTPSNVIHTDTSIWGENTDTFDHRRFLKTPGKKMPSPAAFRAFGGGATLCPGRHFATVEVLSVTTAFIARFDLTPVGSWPPPDQSGVQFWMQIIEPHKNFEVEVSERERFGDDHTWGFHLSESKILLAMAAEDLDDAGIRA